MSDDYLEPISGDIVEEPKDNTIKIIIIVVVLVVLCICICLCIFLFLPAVVSPMVGDVFSDMIDEMMLTPFP